jgi:NAD(P)-dependent dehydrogenase (short-subunit alcohol dehydrogenase family)
MELKGKVALVTGSSRGIGREIALYLGKNGATVAVNYLCEEEKAKDVAHAIRTSGQPSSAIHADVTKPDQAKGLIEAVIREFGQLDILINNVGRYYYKDILELSPAEWLSTIDINLNGTFYCSKYAVENMKRRGYGRIVNIAAAGADQLSAGRFATPYAIAKTGVIILTKSLAVAEAKHGITVNALAPGYVDKEDLPADARRKAEKQIPLGRLASAEEIAEAVVFLVSRKAKYITGACLTISGGWRV